MMYITTLLITFTATLSGILLMFPVAEKLGLVDMPSQRKQHQGNIPLTGGLAMFFGLVSGSLILISANNQHLLWLLVSSGIIILGIVDDARNLSVKIRLFVQTFLAFLLSIIGNLYLENFGNLLNIGDIHLPNAGYLITILAVLGSINAFNMIDGIDGLAGFSALITFSGLAILFGIHSDNYGLQFAICFLSVLLPYLAANLTLPPFKQKIFMGDSGSMLIGLTVVWLLIYGTQSKTPSFRPVTSLWLIAIPLMDMASIMLRRLQAGTSPFMPDRNHLHHVLIRRGLTPSQTLRVISALSLVMVCIGIISEQLRVAEWVMFGGFILMFAIYHHTLTVVLSRIDSRQSIH